MTIKCSKSVYIYRSYRKKMQTDIRFYWPTPHARLNIASFSVRLLIYSNLVKVFCSCNFGGPESRLWRWQEVTCHPETRDHRRDMRTRHWHGDRRSDCRCQVLLGQHHWNHQGIYTRTDKLQHTVTMNAYTFFRSPWILSHCVLHVCIFKSVQNLA